MKEHKGVSGIYSIVNLINQKVYVGKTKDFYKRYCQYVADFRNQSKDRINEYLMNSFIKYGFDNFEFKVIEVVAVELLSERELFWIDALDTTNQLKGYNLRRDSSSGMITHKSTSEKISKRLIKEWEDGVRAGHADKVKESWKHRSRESQANLMSDNLTKYEYVVYLPDGCVFVRYAELCNHGLKNVISKFFKKKCDDVVFKGIRVRRVSIEDKV